MKLHLALALPVLAGCTPTVLVGGNVYDVMTDDPVEGVEFCVEDPVGYDCVTSDAAGHAQLEIEANLDQVTLRFDAADYVDTLTYGNTTDEDNIDATIRIIPDSAIAAIEIATGEQVDDAKGQVVIFVDDLGDTSSDGATGITPSLSPASGTLYYITPTPGVDMDATGTTSTGLSGFMNVDVGDATVSIDGDCYGRWTWAGFAGTQDVEVRAGVVTYLELECTPE